jgi:tRNA threonylcarbamoyl adenosine modification protein (Sua5/YciO/YrdC/YwlC family)
MTQRIDCRDGAHRDRAVTAGAAAIRRGDLVIIPTESVYAIAADAFSPTGVSRLRAAKGLDESSSFAVMVPSATTVSGLSSRISDAARDLMTAFWPGLLTLQVPPQPTLAWSLPAQSPVAVRMPLHPLTLALLTVTGPLVVTTANRPGMPAPVTADEAIAQLGEWTAIALDSGDPIAPDALPSTMVDVTGDAYRIVRVGDVSSDAIAAVLGVQPDGSVAP